MPMSNYPNGFDTGVNIRGLPLLQAYGGDVYWVDSGAGSDGNKGTFNRPFATLDYAVGRCRANNGDIIVLKPGHAETLTADSAVDIDQAGIAVVGLGTGSDRPTFTFTTAVTADFKLAADNTTIINLLFVAGIDALTGPIEVSADDCAIINCEYRDDATNNYETIDVLVTASTPLRMLVDGFKYIMDGGAGGTQNQSVIQLNGADFAIIRNCHLVADSGTGVIEDATTSDAILIENCTIDNSNSGPVPAITVTATTTGSVNGSYLRVASGTTYVTATTDLQFFETYGTGTDNTAGEKVGTILAGDLEAKIDVIDGYHDVATADAVTNTVMSDVIGNKTDAGVQAAGTTKTITAYAKGAVDMLGGAAGVAAWADPAAPADAVSIAEAIRWISSRLGVQSGINPLGSVYYVAASGGNDAATGGGLDPTEPLATIAQAITNASAGDTVVLGPGTHSVDVSAAALTPLADQRFVAAIPPHGGKPSTIITHDADDGATLVLVDVDGVVFEGIEFLMVAGGTTALELVSVSQTTAVNGLSFKDCWFNLNSVDGSGVVALQLDDATNDTKGLSVQHCRFLGGDATTNQAIYVNVGVGGITRALFENNVFELESVDGDCRGIQFADPGAANKSYAMTIRNNTFIGAIDGGDDAIGIVFNAAMTEDEIAGVIHSNFFAHCGSSPVTIDKMNAGIIRNYYGDDATGGTLVDPGT